VPSREALGGAEHVGAEWPRRLEREGKSVRIGKVRERMVRVLGAVGVELRARLLWAVVAEDGMSTAEYAIGTIAAAAFGAVLYGVVTGDSIVNALTKIIDKALNTAV